MTLQDLAKTIDPEKSVLLLGSGVSVPSGGKTGQGLAQYLCESLSDGDIDSEDLAEACSLLEDRYGRPELVDVLATHLNSLRPDGGLLSLVTLPWARAYTTNYDQLVEKACRSQGRNVRVIRTNADFSRLDSGEFELLKIHGCVTRDRALGNTDSMLLSEQDYDDYSNYREALFAKLQFDMHTKDVLIVGHSLKDRHLRELVDRIAAMAKRQGTANRIRVLVYATDPARIRLLQERNLRAASGSLAELTEALQSRDAVTAPRDTKAQSKLALPREILHRTVEVSASLAHSPNAARMFSGGSASYSDIAAGLTFDRVLESEALEQLQRGDIQYLSLIGAAGVGKTTVARRLMYTFHQLGHTAFEHINEFPFAWEKWLTVATDAQDSGRTVFLFVDEAFKHLAGLNRLVNQLAADKIEALRILVSAHPTTWDQRSRSGAFRRLGRDERLSTLEPVEIESLVSLVRSNEAVRQLLDPSVVNDSRGAQIRMVTDRATSDMFVALKYFFSSDSLDSIVLEEFAQLDDDVQEVYKVTSLLEATYAHASRQTILEVMDLDWSDIPLVLRRTKGVLDQKLVDSREGIYVWRTRHRVIAQVVAGYKYHDQDELYFILRKIVNSLNSAMLLDRYIVPSLCDTEWGIGRLADMDRQIELLETLCQRSSSRIPWHRLIAVWVDRDLSRAESVIRQAEGAVGLDSPIARYKARLLVAKAGDLKRLGTDDYIALLLKAEDLAREAIRKWPDNKYSYQTLADVGEALLKGTGNGRILQDAVIEMADAYDRILDDQLLRWRQKAENLLQKR